MTKRAAIFYGLMFWLLVGTVLQYAVAWGWLGFRWRFRPQAYVPLTTLTTSASWPFDPQSHKLPATNWPKVARTEDSWHAIGLAQWRAEGHDLLKDERDQGASFYPTSYQLELFRAGLPLLGLEARDACTVRDSSAGVQIHESNTGSLRLFGNTPRGRRTGPLVLPYFPVWPGFVINVTFFGTACAVAWYALQWMRRARRRRLGQCTCCGHSRESLAANTPCPECGHLPECRTSAGRNAQGAW